jgi:hypothetical protein
VGDEEWIKPLKEKQSGDVLTPPPPSKRDQEQAQSTAPG